MRAAAHAAILALVGHVASQTFSDDTLSRVKANLASSATQSWELGTRAQTLLELDAAPFSVFNDGSIPPPFGSQDANTVSDVLRIAADVVAKLPEDNAARPLDSGAGGDPPSIGIAVLLAHAANPPNASRYQQAAANQLAFVLNRLPRSDAGAISHREEKVQLWNDFIYMTPPFLAYYGAYTSNKTLVQLAFDQCKAYETALYDGGKKLWRHMALGESADTRIWATGNGWAAMGMLRVIATMKHSQWEGDFGDQMDQLETSVRNILDGMYAKLDRKQLMHHNYVDAPETFLEAAGTALVAAATYRLAVLRGKYTHLPDAEHVRQRLVGRIDGGGWLAPVVNPNDFGSQGGQSPEAQAFVLQLHAAHRDWVADGSQGANAAPVSRPSVAIMLTAAIVGAALAW